MKSQTGHCIATIPRPNCYLCRNAGVPLYDNLRDRLFGVPGSWNIRQCSNRQCELAWLDPMPTRKDISKTYQNYYTADYPCLIWDIVLV